MAKLFTTLFIFFVGCWQHPIFQAQATPLPKSIITKNKFLKIMPVGDSITAGYGDDRDGGYRLRLGELLTSNGYKYTFVGTQTAHNPLLKEKLLHEGHDGWTISQIDKIIVSAIKKNNPDVILLMIGTNDMIPAPQNSGKYVQTDYKNLLQRIFTTNSKVTVIVSPILYSQIFSDVQTDDFNLGGRISFNPVIRGKGGLNSLVTSLASQGYNIIFAANMSSQVTKQDLTDGIHPNSIGYKKMAEVWMFYIKNF